MPNPENLKPFQKGDLRINRRGRPRKADAVRKIACVILAEPILVDGQPINLTRLEFLLREWLASNNFRKQLAVLRFAYGKSLENPPDTPHDVSIVVNWAEKITSYYQPVNATDNDNEDDNDYEPPKHLIDLVGHE